METTRKLQDIEQTTRQEVANKPSSQHTQGSASSAVKSAPVSERGSVTEEIKEGAKQKLSEAYDRTANTLNETYDKVVGYGKENPGKMTLIAFGTGIGLGMLLANGMTPRSRMRRFVPPIMNALSEIATQLFH